MRFSLCRTRSKVFQTLARHTFKRGTGPTGIVHAIRNPVVVEEFKLGNVAVQVLLAAMLDRRPSCRA